MDEMLQGSVEEIDLLQIVQSLATTESGIDM